MTGEIPTKVGDALILIRDGGGVRVVCPVTEDGDQGRFSDHEPASSGSAAEQEAARLVAPGGRVFVVNEDIGVWEEWQPQAVPPRD